VDALRADRVFGPGAEKVAPEMVLLSQRCARFTRAYAVYGSTMQSAFAFMRSRYPSQAVSHVPCGHFRIPHAPVPTLAAVLRGAGWSTRASLGIWPLKPECTLSEGFETVEIDPGQLYDPTPRAHQVTDRALGLLETGRPLFLWVHYFDPHQPVFRGADGFGPGAQASDEAAYDWEVGYVDRHLARLVDALDEGALIVLFADHGERFENGRGAGHLGLQADSLHVPLLFCGPGIPAGDIDVPVSLLDLAPTVLELAGISPPVDYVGESLARPMLSGRTAGMRGWAAAEFRDLETDAYLRRALFGPDFSVHADLHLSLFTIRERGVVRRAATLESGTPAGEAFIQLADGHLVAPME